MRLMVPPPEIEFVPSMRSRVELPVETTLIVPLLKRSRLISRNELFETKTSEAAPTVRSRTSRVTPGSTVTSTLPLMMASMVVLFGKTPPVQLPLSDQSPLAGPV